MLRREHIQPPVVEPPDPEAPRTTFSRRQIVVFLIFAAVAIGLLYGLLPKLAGLQDTWQRIKQGDPAWLAVAFLFELLSFGGYIVLFRGVFSCEGVSLSWRASYQITMAGLAATRLLAAGGAGGGAAAAGGPRRARLGARGPPPPPAPVPPAPLRGGRR